MSKLGLIVDSLGTEIQLTDLVVVAVGERSPLQVHALVTGFDFTLGWVETTEGTCKIPQARLTVVGQRADLIPFPQRLLRELQ